MGDGNSKQIFLVCLKIDEMFGEYQRIICGALFVRLKWLHIRFL